MCLEHRSTRARHTREPGRLRHDWVWASPVLLLGAMAFAVPACGAGPERETPARMPPGSAPPAPLPATVPSAAPSIAANAPPTAPSALPDAAVSAPAPLPTPAPCRGSAVDLAAAFSEQACAVGADFATPVPAPGAIVLSLEPATPVVKAGSWVALRVVYENQTSTPCSLVFRLSPGFGFGIVGEPSPRTTDGFAVEARTFMGASLDEPPGPTARGADFGHAQHRVRVEIEPHGRAVADVSWKAVGFLPGKRYRPRRDVSGYDVWEPQPLPPGTYTLIVSTPLEHLGDRLVTTTSQVEIR